MSKKKNNLLVAFILFLGTTVSYAQVGISTSAPKTTLHVVGAPNSTSTADGIQVPALSLAQLDAKIAVYTADQDGAIVYINNIAGTYNNAKLVNITSTGYYYYDASDVIWKVLGGGSGVMRFYSNTSTVGASIGEMSYQAKTALNTTQEYARINANIRNSSVGNYDGSLSLNTTVNGTLTEFVRINGADNESNFYRPLDMNGNSVNTSSGNLAISSTTSSGTGTVDITSKSAVNITANSGAINLVSSDLKLDGANLESNVAGSISGQFLVITLNNVQYKISLLNP